MIKLNDLIFLIMLLTVSFLSLTQTAKAQSEVDDQSSIAAVNLKPARFRLTIDGGLGTLVRNMETEKKQMRAYGLSDSEVNRYFKELKWGEQAGVTFHYMIFKKTGIGLDYNIFTTRSNTKGTTYIYSDDIPFIYYGSISEKIYTSFAGISLIQEEQLGKKWNCFGQLSGGMVFYRNEARFVFPVLYTEDTSAVKGSCGISWSFTSHISMNMGASYMYAYLKKAERKSANHASEEVIKKDLSRLGITTGLQFQF